jgi:bifunctional ADP-heptose synthase (sugar kinase/adenylyltransferase)
MPTSKQQVVVLGDPMLDVWVDLASTRVNPEDASTNVAIHTRTSVRAGGALNVAVNLASLGCQVTYLNLTALVPQEHARLVALLKPHDVSVFGAFASPRGAHLTRKKRVRLDGRLLYREDTVYLV